MKFISKVPFITQQIKMEIAHTVNMKIGKPTNTYFKYMFDIHSHRSFARNKNRNDSFFSTENVVFISLFALNLKEVFSLVS